jgi:hypothetical protein
MSITCSPAYRVTCTRCGGYGTVGLSQCDTCKGLCYVCSFVADVERVDGTRLLRLLQIAAVYKGYDALTDKWLEFKGLIGYNDGKLGLTYAGESAIRLACEAANKAIANDRQNDTEANEKAATVGSFRR